MPVRMKTRKKTTKPTSAGAKALKKPPSPVVP